ncbi:DUF4893 domain-containing protein [Glacieibacterium sp.]|uniref:DUF4893 domain-containing protein n=1 Tax=Glacieibacterium sp. TaxID=2860237 RepID=UPI003B00AFEE
MSRRTSLVALVVLGAVLGAVPAAADPPGWRRQMTEPDRKRLAGLYHAWTTARAQVAAAGLAADWSGQGALTQGDAVTADPPPAPGIYSCRTLKLGSRVAGMPNWRAVGSYPCRIEASRDGLRFTGEGGAQRTSGVLYPDGERMIYLGAINLGNERGGFKYNADVDRNQVGVLHSLGPKRWRLELPFPLWESTLDLIEITPST